MYKSIKKDLKRNNFVNKKRFIKGNRKEEEEEDSYYFLSMNIDLSTNTCSNYEDSHSSDDFYRFLISKLNISKINGIDLNLYTSYTDTTFYDRANFTYTSSLE